jgi:hypothetical protein
MEVRVRAIRLADNCRKESFIGSQCRSVARMLGRSLGWLDYDAPAAVLRFWMVRP